MARIPNQTIDNAPEASKSLLQDVSRVSPTGHPLNLHAQLAAAPDVFQAYTALRRAPEEHSSLERPTRVALMLAAAGVLGNDYTLAIVSMVALRSGWSAAQARSIVSGEPIGDERTDALVAVAREAAGSGGRVSDRAWARAQEAGWGHRQLAEAFSPLALTVFTASFLNYAETPLDVPTANETIGAHHRPDTAEMKGEQT